MILSVIIPVYNAESYILRCLKSILLNPIEDMEIIIVDDFSSDSTLEIIKSINDKRIKIIENKQNLGVGTSRNKGVELASGKYLGFVDNDDFIEPDYFSKMIEKIEKENADICVSLKIINHTGRFSKTHLLSDNVNLFETAFVDRTAPWAKIYKTSFFKENNIKFDPYRGEDIYPAFLGAYLADKITSINDSAYHCTIRKNSISHKKITQDDLSEIEIYRRIIKLAPNLEKIIKRRALISLDFLMTNADSVLKKEILKRYAEIFHSKYPYLEYQTGKLKIRLKRLETLIRAIIQHHLQADKF